MEAKAYVCTTKVEEMNPILATRGIQIPNFAYDFSIPELLNRLRDTNNGGFLLPLHVIEAGNVKSGANPLMLTVGVDITLVGDTGIVRESASCRKKQKTTVGTANIVLSSEDEGSPIGEFHGNKRKDRVGISNNLALIATVPTIISSSPNSPIDPLPPPRLTVANALGVIVDYGPPSGSMKFTASGGERGTLFL
ncbi:hypothetical protein PVK06_034921 [Gossypium arboreum]|uniref:Uncharacterized protein n=1 Tax=Gossypium arboreum TaxID=29729 RepID=A0ABR0NFG7_GOSAR|nr:hypothetical protein PVK06_034921 [Gossypium arboreum]